MAVTRERFAQGMTPQQYLDQMGQNKDQFVKFLGEITIKPEDRQALEKLGKRLNVMVITEDWCGDALYNVPVLFKLVEGNPNVETRVFLRDKNPDLIDQYLNKGIFKSIPVFAFFDEHMNEVARLIERPQGLTDQLEKAMLETRRRTRAENVAPWRQVVVDEVRSLLKA
ncbi:MAG: thioredoxin family protein [Candidatus Rokubacteria bacterium]|nr:thioredoxin family protein [Candidatus Rokubacteria bacterium]MBI3826128.1 thioredoxin family protein [Candidatus Rokubacteria bacterium]